MPPRRIVERGFEHGPQAGSVIERVVPFVGATRSGRCRWPTCVAPDPRGGEADDELWADALEASAPASTAAPSASTSSPGRAPETLRAVVGGGSVYGAVADVLDLSPAPPGRRRRAVGNGYVARRNGKLVVVDPLFADWIGAASHPDRPQGRSPGAWGRAVGGAAAHDAALRVVVDEGAVGGRRLVPIATSPADHVQRTWTAGSSSVPWSSSRPAGGRPSTRSAYRGER